MVDLYPVNSIAGVNRANSSIRLSVRGRDGAQTGTDKRCDVSTTESTRGICVGGSFAVAERHAAYFTVARLVGSEEWVIHTFQVQAAIGDVDSTIATAGRARAAYVFNANHVSSTEFEAAASEIPKAIQRLRELTRDNPQEQQLCSRLESVTQHRIGLFRDSIQLANATPRDQSGQGEFTNQSAVFASETTQVMQQMRGEEQRLLHNRERLSTRLFILVVVILVSTLVLALGLFSVHFRLLSGELTAREQAERTARNSEESLRRLTVCLLQLPDAERRKISRELHDSLGQYLSSVKMNLDRLSRAYGDQESLREALRWHPRPSGTSRVSHGAAGSRSVPIFPLTWDGCLNLWS
jgi:CHASE3 domain sensor protein